MSVAWSVRTLVEAFRPQCFLWGISLTAVKEALCCLIGGGLIGSVSLVNSLFYVDVFFVFVFFNISLCSCQWWLFPSFHCLSVLSFCDSFMHFSQRNTPSSLGLAHRNSTQVKGCKSFKGWISCSMSSCSHLPPARLWLQDPVCTLTDWLHKAELHLTSPYDAACEYCNNLVLYAMY